MPRLICRGEKLSIAIMAGLLEARGHKVSVINPVEKLLAVGHTIWNPPSISAGIHPPHCRQPDPGRPYDPDGRVYRRQ